MFSYLPPESRVSKKHPLRPIRAMADQALEQMSPLFDALYATMGRPSIPPEKLLRAQLIQMLYSIRSERLFMEACRWMPLSGERHRIILRLRSSKLPVPCTHNIPSKRFRAMTREQPISVLPPLQ